MKLAGTALVLAIAAAMTGSAFAQPGGGQRAGPGASAAGMGTGPANGGRAARWGAEYTPGWALMTQQERNEHRDRMRSMQSYDECRTYQQQHHEQMAARAKERGGKALAMPRRDACGALQR